MYYASSERVEAGEVVAVYDLGGGTFDAALLRKTDTSFELIGTPEGIEHLGGLDVDEAVFEHVKREIGGAIEALDPDDPNVVQGLHRLRTECAEAKEALSFDASTAIPVMLPTIQTQVRITRAELERMIRPLLGATIASLHRAFASAEVQPADVRSVLLVGGSSRIPLVAEMISAEVGRPVAVDAHPKHAVALGAAITAGEVLARDTAPAVEPTDETRGRVIAGGVVASAVVADDHGAPAPPAAVAGPPAAQSAPPAAACRHGSGACRHGSGAVPPTAPAPADTARQRGSSRHDCRARRSGRGGPSRGAGGGVDRGSGARRTATSVPTKHRPVCHRAGGVHDACWRSLPRPSSSSPESLPSSPSAVVTTTATSPPRATAVAPAVEQPTATCGRRR